LGPIGPDCGNWHPQKATSLAPWGTLGALRGPILTTHAPPGAPRDPPKRPLEPPKNQSGPPGGAKTSKIELSCGRQLNSQFSPFSTKNLKNATGWPPRAPLGDPRGSFLKTLSPFGAHLGALGTLRSEKAPKGRNLS